MEWSIYCRTMFFIIILVRAGCEELAAPGNDGRIYQSDPRILTYVGPVPIRPDTTVSAVGRLSPGPWKRH